MPRVGDVFQLLSGTIAVPNTTIASSPYNAQQNDWVTEANSPRPVSAGGTGETTAAEARESLGAIGVGDLSGADTKAAVVETDSVVIIDSEDANTNKRWLVSDLETHLLTLNPPVAQPRNRLVNGAFQHSQEYGDDTPATVSGAYPADQWKITDTTTGAGVIAAIWDTATSSQPYRLRLNANTDQVTISSGVWHLSQTIEGNQTADFRWGTTSGSAAVLRIRVQASEAGTYGFFIRNNPATHTYVGTFTISSADPTEVGIRVEKIIPIPAPPTGSVWGIGTGAGITVGFTMAAAAANLDTTPGWKNSGTFYGVTGQRNLMAILNSEVMFSAVSLYFDPYGTGAPPKWEVPDYAEELRACQRYWERISGYANLWSGMTNSGTTYFGAGSWKVVKRITPTVTGQEGNSSGFPSVSGAFVGSTLNFREARIANATVNGGYFYSTVTGDSRL
jgi:hypothetical protein